MRDLYNRSAGNRAVGQCERVCRLSQEGFRRDNAGQGVDRCRSSGGGRRALAEYESGTSWAGRSRGTSRDRIVDCGIEFIRVEQTERTRRLEVSICHLKYLDWGSSVFIDDYVFVWFFDRKKNGRPAKALARGRPDILLSGAHPTMVRLLAMVKALDPAHNSFRPMLLSVYWNCRKDQWLFV